MHSFPEWYQNLRIGTIGGTPVPWNSLIFVSCSSPSRCFLARTGAGRCMRSATAAKYALFSSIDVRRAILGVFVASGVMCSIAAVVYGLPRKRPRGHRDQARAARDHRGRPWRRPAFTAAAAARSSGFFLPSLVLAFVQNSLGLAGVVPEAQQVVTGAIDRDAHGVRRLPSSAAGRPDLLAPRRYRGAHGRAEPQPDGDSRQRSAEMGQDPVNCRPGCPSSQTRAEIPDENPLGSRHRVACFRFPGISSTDRFRPHRRVRSTLVRVETEVVSSASGRPRPQSASAPARRSAPASSRSWRPCWSARTRVSRACGTSCTTAPARTSGRARPRFPDRRPAGVAIVGAISGIDIALWDLLGKSLACPCGGCSAAGSVTGSRLRLGVAGRRPAARQAAPPLRRSGRVPAVKMRVGTSTGRGRLAARVREARAELGPEVELMVDAHGTWSVREAQRFARKVVDCDLAWLEEPVRPTTSRVRRRCAPPPTSRSRARAVHAVQVPRPHRGARGRRAPARCGHRRRHHRDAAPSKPTASAHQLRFAPHLAGGALTCAAGLHVAAVASSGFILEYSLGANPMLHELAHEDFLVVDASSRSPTVPASACIDEAFVEQYRVPAAPQLAKGSTQVKPRRTRASRAAAELRRSKAGDEARQPYRDRPKQRAGCPAPRLRVAVPTHSPDES